MPRPVASSALLCSHITFTASPGVMQLPLLGHAVLLSLLTAFLPPPPPFSAAFRSFSAPPQGQAGGGARTRTAAREAERRKRPEHFRVSCLSPSRHAARTSPTRRRLAAPRAAPAPPALVPPAPRPTAAAALGALSLAAERWRRVAGGAAPPAAGLCWRRVLRLRRAAHRG